MSITSVRTKDSNFEALRTIAVGLVILLHTSGQLLDWSKNNFNFDFWIYNIFDSFSRVCVPLFLMISGKFLLQKSENYLVFYKKRFSRILFPLIFWTIVFSFFSCWMLFGRIDFQYILNGIKIGRPYYHLWYLFMLPGMYLISPFLQFILKTTSKQHKLIISFAFIMISMIYDIIVFNYKLSIPFPFWFMSYLGYYVLGNVIGNEIPRFKSKTYLVFYITTALLIAFFTWFTMSKFNGNQYFYAASSPIVVLSTYSLFNLIRSLKFDSNHILVRLGKYSFGIYLIHTIPLELIFKYEQYLHFSELNPLIKIIFYFSISATISLFSSIIIYKYFRKIIE